MSLDVDVPRGTCDPVRVALGEIGNGEEPPRSNAGPHVAKYLGAEYKPGREWCAGFVAWCLEHAGFMAPMQGSARRGARALVRWVAEHGEWTCTPQMTKSIAPSVVAFDIRPGDVICWKRSRLVPWMAHVGMVTGYHADTGRIAVVEGNVRGKVRHTVLSAREWPQRMRGLYGIARPRAA